MSTFILSALRVATGDVLCIGELSCAEDRRREAQGKVEGSFKWGELAPARDPDSVTAWWPVAWTPEPLALSPGVEHST